MPLSMEDRQAVDASTKYFLGLGLCPVGSGLIWQLAAVLANDAVEIIQRKTEQYGREHGMIELLEFYKRGASGLDEIKNALERMGCNANDFFPLSGSQDFIPKIPLSIEDKQALNAASKWLIKCCHPSALIPNLIALGIITYDEKVSIEHQTQQYGCSYGVIELLEFYKRRASGLDDLKNALKMSKVEVLEYPSDSNDFTRTTTKIPLSIEAKQALDAAAKKLMQDLHPFDLIPCLIATGGILYDDKDIIMDKTQQYGRSYGMSVLLEFYKRRASSLDELKYVLEDIDYNVDDLFAPSDSQEEVPLLSTALNTAINQAQNVCEIVDSLATTWVSMERVIQNESIMSTTGEQLVLGDQITQMKMDIDQLKASTNALVGTNLKQLQDALADNRFDQEIMNRNVQQLIDKLVEERKELMEVLATEHTKGQEALENLGVNVNEMEKEIEWIKGKLEKEETKLRHEFKSAEDAIKIFDDREVTEVMVGSLNPGIVMSYLDGWCLQEDDRKTIQHINLTSRCEAVTELKNAIKRYLRSRDETSVFDDLGYVIDSFKTAGAGEKIINLLRAKFYDLQSSVTHD